MSEYDRDAWEGRWRQALQTHGEGLAQRSPNAHLTAELSGLPPGRALDAGCGHGSEAIWLAANGWEVTAVDFSATALEFARSTAAAMEVEVDWVEADLGSWAPEPAAFDLVVSLHVHVSGTVDEFVGRMASGVAPGGRLFLVGHRGDHGQTQVGLDAATGLDPAVWTTVLAEERPRTNGTDVVLLLSRV